MKSLAPGVPNSICCYQTPHLASCVYTTLQLSCLTTCMQHMSNRHMYIWGTYSPDGCSYHLHITTNMFTWNHSKWQSIGFESFIVWRPIQWWYLITDTICCTVPQLTSEMTKGLNEMPSGVKPMASGLIKLPDSYHWAMIPTKERWFLVDIVAQLIT